MQKNKQSDIIIKSIPNRPCAIGDAGWRGTFSVAILSWRITAS
jgi:hypothetical protein